MAEYEPLGDPTDTCAPPDDAPRPLPEEKPEDKGPLRDDTVNLNSGASNVAAADSKKKEAARSAQSKSKSKSKSTSAPLAKPETKPKEAKKEKPKKLEAKEGPQPNKTWPRIIIGASAVSLLLFLGLLICVIIYFTM